MSLQWRPAMAIDGGIIDHDHKVLIAIINDFIELRPQAAGTAEMLRTLARLYHYVNSHFAREEALQNAVGYPEAAAHKTLHAELGQKLDSISLRLKELDARPVRLMPAVANGPDLAVVDNAYVDTHSAIHRQMSELLRNWVLVHILRHDLPMRDLVGAMNPFAAQMPSLWTAKPVSLAPNVATPDAVRQALHNPKSWMNARFHDEQEPQRGFAENDDSPDAPVHWHPVIARMARQAKAIGMTIQFDTACTEFHSAALAQVHRDVTAAPNAGAAFDFTPTDARNYLRQVALFERTAKGPRDFAYRALYAGPYFERIFGDVTGHDLATVKSPDKLARWKLLIDGVLEFNAPLRVVSIASAFDRDDLVVERLLIPFDRGARYHKAVLVAASYKIALD